MLASILGATTQLEKMVLIIPKHGTDKFEQALLQASVTLPFVQTLVTGPNCGPFIIPLCLRVTRISISSSFTSAAPEANNGKSFLTKMMGYLKTSSAIERRPGGGKNGIVKTLEAAGKAQALHRFGIAICLVLVQAEGM